MDPDKLGATAVIALAVYTWGCLNRGWTSPVDIGAYTLCMAGVHRWCWHDQPSSEAEGADDRTPDPEVSAPAVQPGPLRPPVLLARPLEEPGPLPVQPAAAAGEPADPTARLQYETRVAWTRRQIDAGLLTPSEIDQLGAEMFGVHPDSIRRYRRQIGDDRPETSTERTTR